jgi:protein TonB
MVKESSGFQSLDNAAVKAVQKWKFAPARMGSLAIASHVDIPIRFQLNNSR